MTSIKLDTIPAERESYRVERSRADRNAPAPQVSRWLIRWFAAYCRRYLSRHFHGIRLLRGAEPCPSIDTASVVYLNHPSWWDPLVGLYLSQHFFGGHGHFAPMDEATLARFRFFRRLGFFGVRPASRTGALQFARAAKQVLSISSNMLWVTAQGEFTDARERPVHLRRGIGHLACVVPRITFLPLAIEYAFWDERYAEVLVAFGSPVQNADIDRDKDAWTHFFASELEKSQDRLRDAAKSRDPARFSTLLERQSGTDVMYDLWCRIRDRGGK